jgi:hypothetical protein
MLSKRDRQGYLLIDNRCSGGGVLEAATITCSHCQRQLIRNPARERERAWCPNCDAYICDSCEAVRPVAGCRTFAAILEEHEKLITERGMI